MIREGWLESENIASLDAPAERFFLRLCLRADDFGRFHANPLLLRSSLFPLHEDVRSTTDIPRWLAACEKAGLLRCYSANGTRYLEIPKFGQRMRAAVSKFPPCPTNDGHMSDTCRSHVSQPRPESEAEAETKTESKTKTESESAGAPVGGSGTGQLVLGTKSADEPPPFPPAIDTPEFRAVWADWLQHRKEKRKPVTPLSLKHAMKELEQWGADRAIAAIRHSIANGWTGIFEPDAKKAAADKARGQSTYGLEKKAHGYTY